MQVQVIDGTSLQCSTLRPWTGPPFGVASDKMHIESLTRCDKKLQTIFGFCFFVLPFVVEDLVAIPGQA